MLLITFAFFLKLKVTKGSAARLTAIFWQEQITIGSAEVRATFSSGSGRVAGCMVTEGKVQKGCGIRVIRKGKVIHVGILDSLRRVKEDVKEV